MLAIDIMNPKVLTLPDTTPIREVVQTLVRESISGAPVVDSEGTLAGVVSMADCLRAAEEGAAVTTRGLCFHQDLWWDLENDRAEKTIMALDETLTARDVMTPEAFTVSEVTPVTEVIQLMLHRRIHRVVVTSSDEIQGLITTVDLMKVLERTLKTASPAG